MEEKLTEIKTEKTEQTQKEINHYSIYDYLKEKTAVLLAFISAMVAIVTFFAKILTLIITRKQLAFWEFDTSYANFSNEPIMYTIILAIIFSFCITASSMLFCSTFEAFLQYKKIQLWAKCYLEKRNSKAFVKISKKGKITKLKISPLKKAEHIKKSMKVSKKSEYNKLFFNLFFVFVILSFNSIFFAVNTVSDFGSYTWLIVAFTILICQIIPLLLLAMLMNKTIIKKKEIKRKCNNINYIEKIHQEQKYKEYPFNNIFKNGLRTVFTNYNIISIILVIILNCVVLSCHYTFTEFDPTEKSKTFQITSIDNIPYAIVYQDNEKYYLEEIKTEVENIKDKKTKEHLIVYTNKQRIITSNDIIIEVKNFADIKKEHKTETIPKDKNNE